MDEVGSKCSELLPGAMLIGTRARRFWGWRNLLKRVLILHVNAVLVKRAEAFHEVVKLLNGGVTSPVSILSFGLSLVNAVLSLHFTNGGIDSRI